MLVGVARIALQAAEQDSERAPRLTDSELSKNDISLSVTGLSHDGSNGLRMLDLSSSIAAGPFISHTSASFVEAIAAAVPIIQSVLKPYRFSFDIARDGAMRVFALSRGQSERALAASLATCVLRIISQLSERLSDLIPVVGMAHGEALVGNIGSNAYRTHGVVGRVTTIADALAHVVAQRGAYPGALNMPGVRVLAAGLDWGTIEMCMVRTVTFDSETVHACIPVTEGSAFDSEWMYAMSIDQVAKILECIRALHGSVPEEACVKELEVMITKLQHGRTAGMDSILELAKKSAAQGTVFPSPYPNLVIGPTPTRKTREPTASFVQSRAKQPTEACGEDSMSSSVLDEVLA